MSLRLRSNLILRQLLSLPVFPRPPRLVRQLPINPQNQNPPSLRNRILSLGSRSRRRPFCTSRTTSIPSSMRRSPNPLPSRQCGLTVGNAILIICLHSPPQLNSNHHTLPLLFHHRSRHHRTRRTRLNRRHSLATTSMLTPNTILVSQ